MIKKIIGKTFVTIICLAPIARIYSKKSVKGITIETEKIEKDILFFYLFFPNMC